MNHGKNQVMNPVARKRLIVMLAGAGVVFGLVFGLKWFSGFMMEKYMASAPVPPVTISSAEAKPMTWGSRLETLGTFVAVNGTRVTTEAAGIVQAIHFESGQRVEKGAPLVTLDSANEAAELKRLEAQARLAELNRERRQKMLKLNHVSKSDYDAAVAEAAAAKAAADAQRAKLAQKNLRAPFAGQLGIRQVNVGEYLAPGAAVVSLQALDPIYVDFTLPEQNLSLVAPGQKVNVTVDLYPGQTFTGEIEAIEPGVDEATRNFRLRARLENADYKLRAGVFGRVEVELPGSIEVVAVPRTAINYSSYGSSVFVVQRKKDAPPADAKPAEGAPAQPALEVTQRFVRTGQARGDFVAVTEGLKAGEQIATSGLLKLRNQQPVIINNSVQPQAELKPTVPQS